MVVDHIGRENLAWQQLQVLRNQAQNWLNLIWSLSTEHQDYFNAVILNSENKQLTSFSKTWSGFGMT